VLGGRDVTGMVELCSSNFDLRQARPVVNWSQKNDWPKEKKKEKKRWCRKGLPEICKGGCPGGLVVRNDQELSGGSEGLAERWERPGEGGRGLRQH